jgi:tetratricopeptide (TPR) repeat protein
MSEEPKPAMTLDPEMLAAYIDKRLTPEQRAAVEAQLASDPDSYALLVESMKALDALEGEQRALPFVASKKPSMQRLAFAAGILAAAATIVFVVRLDPEWLARWSGRSSSAASQLVSAVGSERLIDARLSGDFKYAPPSSSNRGTDVDVQENLALLDAAVAAQAAANNAPTAANLHAWGTAQLLLRRLDDAIITLEQASRKSANASVLTDLSAAYLERSKRADARPSDLQNALEAVDRALANQRGLAALFNRALALEALHRTDEALTAWRSYLAVDAESGWAEEAKLHIKTLENASTPRARAVP